MLAPPSALVEEPNCSLQLYRQRACTSPVLSFPAVFLPIMTCGRSHIASHRFFVFCFCSGWMEQSVGGGTYCSGHMHRCPPVRALRPSCKFRLAPEWLLVVLIALPFPALLNAHSLLPLQIEYILGGGCGLHNLHFFCISFFFAR